MRRHLTPLLLLCLARVAVAAPLAVTVLNPDGTPAAGAKAVLVPSSQFLRVTDGREFDPDPTYTHAVADAAGRLAFAGVRPPYLVCVVNDAGQADFNDRTLPKDGVVRMAKWATVTGRVRVGPRPVAGRKVVVQSSRTDPDWAVGPQRPSVTYESDAVTDPDGHYAVHRVCPGTVEGRAPAPLQDLRVLTFGPRIATDVSPGKTATIDFGGKGRTVVGRITVPNELTGGGPYTIDFGALSPPYVRPVPTLAPPADATPAELAAWAGRADVRQAQHATLDATMARIRRNTPRMHEFDIAPDGTFAVADVTPGAYRLTYGVTGPWLPGARRRVVYAEPEFSFTVTDDGQDSPTDLGTIMATTTTYTKKPAPAFAVPGLDGRPVRLSDYRGKFLLVDFWATWCGPCVAEDPNLKAVYAKHVGDLRFAMIGLCGDDFPDKPTEHVRKHAMPWPQGFLGGTDGPVSQAYEVDGIPNIMLIGPDGKILARGLRGAQVGRAVDNALARAVPGVTP